MDPLTQVAITVAYNQLLEVIEEPWTYTHSNMAPFIRRTGQMFRYAVENQAHFVPSDGTDIDDLLIAFEKFTRGVDREYMMMGLGPVQGKNVDSVALESGTLVSVGWPKAGVRELATRLGRGSRCRMVCVHNHPHGLVHDLCRVLGLGLPGASSQDRDVATKHMINAVLRNEIVPEFYLVENQQFRRILAPSWETVAGLLRAIFEPRKAPPKQNIYRLSHSV